MLNLPLFILDEEDITSEAAAYTFTLSDYTLPTAWTGLHLVVLVNAASPDAVAERDLEWTFNGASSAFNEQIFKGSSSSKSAARASSQAAMTLGTIPGTSVHASAVGGGMFLLADYADTARHKTLLGFSGAAENSVVGGVGRWGSTAAVTSITVAPSSGNFAIGSRFVLALVDERYRVQADVKTDDLETFDFQNIPALTGQLVILGLLRSDNADTRDSLDIALNNDTTGYYGMQSMRGDSTILAGQSIANREINNASIAGDNATAAVFGVSVTTVTQYGLAVNDPDILHVAGVHESTGPASRLWVVSGRRNNVEAINRFAFTPGSGTNFMSGSALWLYHVPRRDVRRFFESGGGAAEAVFSDLPAGEALVISVYARSDNAAINTGGIRVEFNSDTTPGNYDRQRLLTAASTTTADQSGSNPATLDAQGADDGANRFAGGQIIVFAFSKTDRHKHTLTFGDRAESNVIVASTRWESTAAITSVKLIPNGGEWVDGTVIEVSVVPSLASQTVTRKTHSTVTT